MALIPFDHDDFVVPPTSTDVSPRAKQLAGDLLEELMPHLDWESEHAQGTPERFARMLLELTTAEEFKFTTFENNNNLDEMVIVQDIPFYSVCAHHVVPFYGVAHVAYIPDDLVAGLSKLARAVRYMSRSLWVQEHLTDAICNFLEDNLQPRGVAVVLQAEHMCMVLRGAQVPGTRTTTSAMRGVFLDPAKKARDEFLMLIRSR